ncbi:MAG: hypothetical protein WCF99_01310, partial [Chloroflexales bacterium]
MLAHLTKHPITDIALSSITIAELQFGVSKSTIPHQNQHIVYVRFSLFSLWYDFPKQAVYRLRPLQSFLIVVRFPEA